MNKQDMQKQHRRVLQDSAEVKEHFKMYKVGKTWLFAGLFTLSLGAGMMLGDHPDVHAAVVENKSEVVQPTATQTNLQAKNVVIGDKTQSQEPTSGMKADTDVTGTTTEPETENQETENQGTENQGAGTPSSTETKTPSTSDTQTKAATANVQTTNLGDVTDQTTIDRAKSAAAEAYAKTGTPQVITAVSGAQGESATTADADPVETRAVTVENATKAYDGKTDTPANVNVKLSDNLAAPADWFVTSTKDEYLVPLTSANFDLSQVSQNVGTYEFTLSADALDKLNNVTENMQKNLTVAATDVTAGELTITKASIASGLVAIQDASKLYDNDASTDPTSYKVKVDSSLVAPSDWTSNSDGTYTVTLDSGDLNADITSQQPGTYEVTLSDVGLQKLNAVNTNYDIKADRITAGKFKIANNTKLNIGVATIAVNTNLPSTLTVSLSREETHPSDWTVNYDNTGQDDIVYNVPISYFDTSTVDKTAVGTYTVNLTATALANLNAANPDRQIATTNIKAGQVFVVNALANVPERTIGNFGGGFPESMNGKVMGDGDGTQLTLNFFSADQGSDYQNFTDIVIVPAGMTIADKSETTVNGQTVTTYTKSADPAQSFENQVKTALDQKGTNYYSDFKVTQLSDYKNRQAFAVQWGDVNTVGHTGDKFDVNIMVDPDVKDVTTVGYGDLQDENDAAILYATDSSNLTGGKYTINYGGAYPSIQPVATALGLTDAITISDGYAKHPDGSTNVMWAGHFTIVHKKVQDTYTLTDQAGNTLATITNDGNVGDTYDPLSVLPAIFTADDGTQYVLDKSSMPAQTFGASADASANVDPSKPDVAPGATYTVKYKQVLSSSQVQIGEKNMTWGAATPDTFTVTLPSNLKAPSDWAPAGNNTYTVTTADGDLDLSTIKNVVTAPNEGYDIQLSNQGLSKLAAANSGYLFDNTIDVAGKLNVKALDIPVTVEDTAGKTIKPTQTLTLGNDTKVSAIDASVSDYPTDQLNKITLKYANTPQNKSGIKQSVISVDKVKNTITQINSYYDTSKPDTTSITTSEQLGSSKAGDILAFEFNHADGSAIDFGVTSAPEITFDQAIDSASLTGIDVVYNQKVTATLVPSDENGNPISNTTPTTVTVFPGDSISVTDIPEVPGYTPESNVTIPNEPDYTVKVKYTPNNQIAKVQFEDQKGNILNVPGVGDAIELTGPSDSNIDYTKALNAQKALISQGYFPINGDKTGFAAAPKTFDRDDKATQPIIVKLSKYNDQVPANATLVPVDVKGEPIKNTTSTTVTGLPGTIVNAPDVPGYTVIDTNKTVTIPTPVPSIDKDTGEVPTPDKRGTDVPVTYTANSQTITINFTDEKGKALGSTMINGQTDGVVDASAAFAKEQSMINEGYTPKNGLNNGLNGLPATFTSHSQLFTVQLTKINATDANLTIVPMGPDGKPIPNTTSTTVTGVPGTDVNVPNVQGYTPTVTQVTVPTPVPTIDKDTGEVPTPDKRGTTVTVTYTPNDAKNNVDIPTNLGPKTVPDVTGKTGDHLEVNVPSISGYSKDKTTVPVTVNPDGTITVDNPKQNTVTYTAEPQSIQVQFVDKDNKNTDLGSAVILTGVTNGKVNLTKAFTEQQMLLNQGYTLAGDNNNGLANVPATFTEIGKVPTYVVELSHVRGVELTAVPYAPYANQYTVNYVTPNGDVVGTTTVVGNPGNRFDVSGNVPNGYVLNGTDGDVEVPNNQDPKQPITVSVTVPATPSGNDGTTDVPGGSSTDNGTGTPSDGTDTTTDGSDNNTVPGGDESGSNPVTGGKDNNVVSTDNGQKTVGQPTSLGGANSNAGAAQSGLVQQSSQAAAAQSQLTSNSSANNSGATVNKAGNLPQTNEQNTSVWALLGLGLMSMLSLLGFTKQKKREDDK